MDLSFYIGLLRRRWFPVIVCIVAGLGGAITVTSSQPKSYRATSRLFVNIPAAADVQQALQGVQLSTQLLQSFTRMATSRTAAERTAARMQPPQSLASVQGHLTATAQPDTLLIDVSANDPSPTRARDMANSAAQALTELISEFDPWTEGAVAARIIDPAIVPTSPVSPRPRVNLALGLLLGLGVGIATALLIETLDRSIKTAGQAEHSFGAPVLATLPRHRRKKGDPLPSIDHVTSASGEAYRSLRTSLRFLDAGSPLSTILVTSASPSEGKTTVAANLAIALAQSGERVIVIEADLRRPRLASLYGLSGERGLTSVIFDEIDLERALHAWRPNLAVLPSGPLPTNQSEVLGSEAMADLLERATNLADVVIIDAPPVLPVTDATVLGALVDGVLLVCRFGITDRGEAAEASRTLRSVGAAVVGVVMNAVPGTKGGSYYGTYRPASGSEPDMADPMPTEASTGRISPPR